MWQLLSNRLMFLSVQKMAGSGVCLKHVYIFLVVFQFCVTVFVCVCVFVHTGLYSAEWVARSVGV